MISKQNLVAFPQFFVNGIWVAFFTFLIFVSGAASADDTFKHGAVMARSLALDKNNQPILVEYNEDGSEGAEVAIPSDYKTRVSELVIMSAAEYHYQTVRLSDYRSQHQNDLAVDAEVMSRTQFLGQTFVTAAGVTMANPTLPTYVKSVLVRGRSNRIINSPDQLVLLSFTVDLSQSFSAPETGTLVLDPNGRVIKSSSLNIAPRVGFFGDATKKQEFYTPTRLPTDTIFGPVPWTKVYVAPEIFPGSLAVTDEKGKYSMHYYMGFCPAMMDMETDVWAELHYANFSPHGTPVLPYYLRRQDWSLCWDPVFMGASNLMEAMAYVDVLAIKATMAIPSYNIDMKVDVMFLSGRVGLQNPDGSQITIGDKTEYKADAPDKTPIAQGNYDLDGDGHPDNSVLGKVVSSPQPDGSSLPTFEADENGDVQGVYLSSHGGRNGQPDLFRLADTTKKIAHVGFLKSISKDDLKKTDVLVFREATGDLILQRQGVQDAEIDGREQEGLGKDDKYFFYRIMLRGPLDNALNIGGTNRTGTWEEWSTRNKLAEPFQKRQSDQLKPGEWIRLVVINRVTGYMATQRIQLSDASKNPGGYLNVPLNDALLMPPNLKIWAERTYSVDNGLTAGEDRHYLIGDEGTSLTSDALIQVYSEWYDEEGRPLPEGLGADEGAQYGLTGRLAKVISNNTLGEVAGNQLANFPIAPGHHTQVLKVKDNLSSPDHFYIHVSGTQKNENPNFDPAGQGVAAPFDSRPRGLTPFFTPLYDEQADWFSISAWSQAKKAFNAGTSSVKPLKPAPFYQWAYRPEYQFSQYQLEVDDITRTTANSGDKSLLNDPNLQLGSKNVTDQLINIFYSLIASNQDRLTPIDGDQDLVLTVGQEEIKATLGSNGQIHFDNLEHLAYLSQEDFLTIRLYSNQDAGNVLWEFAFDTIGSAELSRSYSLAQYNDEPALKVNLIDSYQTLSIPLETESTIQVDVLDTDKHLVKNLISAQKFPLGVQNIVVLRKDLEDFIPREGTDAYISIKTTPTNGEKSHEKLYAVDLNTTVHGEMLGQIIEYDTLIQRGSLTLRREDMVLPGIGVQMDFSRSFSNEPKPENNKSVLSPGWSHNQDIFVQVLAYGDGQPPYENNLPGWISATRDGPLRPKILSSETLANLMTHNRIPTVVSVSNGGSFKLVGNSWINQRGNHGTLAQTSDGGWEYISKDGTSYKFGLDASLTGKHHVKTVTDRNGNILTYDYTYLNGEQFVTNITDPAKRKLSFSYSMADNGHFQLDTVESSVGVTLEFSYFKRPSSGYDPRAGMLQSFKRGTFTESYDYSQLPTDPSVNLSTVADADGHLTRYEYYAEADVPALLGNYVPGLNRNDVVHKVYYPSAANDVAEITYPVTGSQNIREVSDLRQHKTKYTLNLLGNPTKEEEPEGKTTTFEWSADMGEPDNLLRKRVDVSITANWEYQYDAKGNLAKEIDPYGNTTEQSWDQKYTVLLYRKDKNGNVLQNQTDANGNVTSEIQTATVNGATGSVETKHTYGTGGAYKGALRTTTNGRSFVTKFDYDTYGTIASVVDPEGSTTFYENNARGVHLSEQDPAGNVTQYEYDDLDHLTLKTDAEGNTIEYSYDTKGNKKSETTHDNYVVDGTKHIRYLKLAYNYDARDRVKDVTRTGNLDGGSPLSGTKTYAYDGNSNLVQESDWKGVQTTHTYDGLNRRTGTTNRGGVSESYAYEFSSGLKTTTTDFAGRVSIAFTDKLDRKTKVIHPTVNNSDGSSNTYQRTFTYDKLKNIVDLNDENGHSTKYRYDGRNLKIGQTNADGKNYEWQYDAAGNLSKTIDEASHAISYVYDKQNRLTEKQLPEKQKWQYSYFENGTLKTAIDPWHFSYAYTYNKIKQRTSVTNPDGGVETESYTNDGKLVYKKDAEERVTKNLYGPEGRLVVAEDARGRKTTNTYDDNNNLIDITHAWGGAVTGPDEVALHSVYDRQDHLMSTINAYGSSASQLIEYKYDNMDNRIEESKPDGRVTNFEYDELDRVKKIKMAAVDGLNQNTLQVWDGLGNKLSVVDRRGNTTTTEYDVLNRPSKVTNADNKIISYSYDAVGNLLNETDRRGHSMEHNYDGLNRETERFVNDNAGKRFRLVKNEYDIGGVRKNAITDANGNRVESVLDWHGKILVTTLPAGADYAASTVTNVYDKSGFLRSSTDAAGYTTQFEYYADGAVASTTNPEGETTSLAYDLFANKAQITKPSGAKQTFVYDEQNRVIEITDAMGGVTHFDYDQNNNLRHQFMPAANDSGDTEVEYTYDALNRKRTHIQYKSGGNLTTKFIYDAEGNLVETTDAKGQVFNQTYDALNRLTIQNFPVGDINNINTTYDANGNSETITEHKASSVTEITKNTYDLLNRLDSQDQRGHLISYTYDNNGNRTKVSSPGGDTSYTFDSRNRLSTVIANGIAKYTYYSNSWLQQVAHANGTKVVYAYDGAGRTKTIINSLGNGNVLSQFAYTYDANGNRTQQIETQNGFLTVQALTTNYVFDNLDRLQSYRETAGADITEHSFNYYPSYDRKTETVVQNGTTIKARTYNYDQTYWLNTIKDTADSHNTININYTYDNNGNMLHKTDTTSGGILSTLFTYNTRNQLKSVAQGAVGAEIGQGTHDYNYMGMRIRHIGSERGDIEYIYDSHSVIDELQNNSNTQVAHYRYGDRLLSLTTAGGDQFYHYAALGTTANLTNAAGQQQVAYRTDIFGGITKQDGNSVNRHVFTGKEIDEKTKLVYFGARFYDPDTARFINQDSYLGVSTNPPSLHRYLYAYANPTAWVDPTGHYDEAGHYYTPLIVAMAAGYSPKDAAKLAMYAQIPDEVGRYDAISRAINEGTSSLSILTNPLGYVRNVIDRVRYQDGLHLLTGGNAEKQLGYAKRVIADADKNDLATIGTAIHPLGDSFAHRQLSDESKTYASFYGHLFDKHDPDLIHKRKELYFDYVKTLALTLSEKTGKKMTQEDISGLQNTLWAAVEGAKTPKMRSVQEYVDVSNGGGFIANGAYPTGRTIVEPIPGTIDDEETGKKTIQNLKSLANQKVAENSAPGDNTKDSLLSPENHDLKYEGAFSNRGTVSSELKDLLKTRSEKKPVSDAEVKELYGTVNSAVDRVANKINKLRAEDKSN